jgi:signal transduction histidine kinase
MEKVKAMGTKITQSVRQLDTLLNNLLNWAMSQTDAMPYRPEPLQLNHITKECYVFFEHALELKQITLLDKTQDDFFVFADRNALSAVLRNLISNATKFTPNQGAITISTRLTDDFVWVDIADTGVGLAKEKIDSLFSLSENKTTSGTSGEKGTGLGLVLCADYVALNKGSIKVESEVGKGTVFSFSIPSFQPKELQQLKQEMIHG